MCSWWLRRSLPPPAGRRPATPGPSGPKTEAAVLTTSSRGNTPLPTRPLSPTGSATARGAYRSPTPVDARPPGRQVTAAAWHAVGMVLEVGLIDVQEGREDEFAAAYAKAYPILATTPGCRTVRMTRGVETPTRFVLMVEWDSVDAHLDNFRATERFKQWRGLIGPYFDGAPRVEHFLDVPAS